MLHFSILILAATLTSVAVAQFVAAGYSVSRTQRRFRSRRFQTLKTLRNAAEIARVESELQVSAASAGGLGWRVMEIAQWVDESADCRSFYLVDPYRQSLPEFRPGQYVMVRPATAGAFQATRCYSLSSVPDARYWRITVKRQELDAGTDRNRNGGLSCWLHSQVGVGDCLLIGGPSGHFFLPPESRDEPLVLLAAGVGITPMASMLRWSMEHTPHRPVTLLFQAKDLDHWPLGKSIHQWIPDFPNCRIISYFSRHTTDELQQSLGASIEAKSGKLTASDALQALELDNCRYYMCGPETWMENLRSGLTAAGVPAEHLHWESFGGIVESSTATASNSAPTRKVQFERSRVQADWSTPGKTVWELARENDVELPSGCLSGVCGSCRVQLLSGHVTYDRKVAIELAENECLACVAQPQSDLRIDA